MEHFDFTSMYPAMQCDNLYPLGHPIIHTERFPDDLNTTPDVYKGVIKCEVLGPKGLFVPVLPARINKKLHFTLCRTCSEKCQQGKCQHTDNARVLCGTWTTVELQKAVECGYVIKHVYEVWHWAEWSANIFKEYIATFYKIKLGASGFPSWCTTDNDKERYIENLRVTEGFTMSITDIVHNKGLRTVAKGMINTNWGKFGEQLTHQKVVYSGKVSTLQTIMANKLDTIQDLYIVNDDIIRIQYTTDVQNTPPKIFQNVAIAAHVTSYGRLCLYSQLSVLGELLCYCDTDSCLFQLYEGSDIMSQLNISDGLGKMISECGHNEHIVRFVCLGPKCYGYECNTCTGRQKLCVKGIPQKVRTTDIVTLSNMEKMIGDYCRGKQTDMYVFYPYNIFKNAKTGVITSSPTHNEWRPVIDKCVLKKESGITYPFGFGV
jgi:hypothetical protein